MFILIKHYFLILRGLLEGIQLKNTEKEKLTSNVTIIIHILLCTLTKLSVAVSGDVETTNQIGIVWKTTRLQKPRMLILLWFPNLYRLLVWHKHVLGISVTCILIQDLFIFLNKKAKNTGGQNSEDVLLVEFTPISFAQISSPPPNITRAKLRLS